MRGLWTVLGGVFVISTVILLNGAKAGSPPPSSELGSEIAARWCAACHVVAASGAGTDSAPAFATIAAKREADDIRAFLMQPHAKPMRGFTLTEREIIDVTAYIQSLK